MVAVATIEQFTLGMGEKEKRRRVRFDIAQRHDVKIDVGDLPAAVRHFITQDAFGLNPIVFRGFTNHDKQVIGHRVAVRRTADQFTEQQDIFGVEISICQSSDDPGSFGRVVKTFCGLFEFEGYALCRVFLRGILIRFHLIDF